jgi:hypothetical protein
VFCNYLSEERFVEDRAAIFVVAIEGSIDWGITKANLFSTPSLLAVHLKKKDLQKLFITTSPNHASQCGNSPPIVQGVFLRTFRARGLPNSLTEE